MDNQLPDCGPFRTLRELMERVAKRAPTMMPRINEIIADHTINNVDTSRTPVWPISQAVMEQIAADTGCIILGVCTDHGMRWSATFTEHREQLEPA